MATNAVIGIEREDGKVESVHCHWDGYIEYTGKILLERYQSREKVKSLIEMGNISLLGNDLGSTYFYGRDQGIEGQGSRITEKLEMDLFENYGYLFTLNNKWLVIKALNRNKEIVVLEEELSIVMEKNEMTVKKEYTAKLEKSIEEITEKMNYLEEELKYIELFKEKDVDAELEVMEGWDISYRDDNNLIIVNLEDTSQFFTFTLKDEFGSYTIRFGDSYTPIYVQNTGDVNSIYTLTSKRLPSEQFQVLLDYVKGLMERHEHNVFKIIFLQHVKTY